MNHMVITIGCEYGSGGPEIGRVLAQNLDLAYYDRPLIDEIIQEAGLSKDVVEKANTATVIKGRSRPRSASIKAGTDFSDLTERLVYIQSEVIKKLAERESCVIIGRCSDYILRERTDCLNLFVYAPEEVRVKNVVQAEKVSAEKARQIIRENDDLFHARYEYMTGTSRGDRHNRHLLIDCSVLGLAGTTDYIQEFVVRRFNL